MKVIAVYVEQAPPPVKSVIIELNIAEAAQLQRTVTSVLPSLNKDRLYQALTDMLRANGIPGGIYV